MKRFILFFILALCSWVMFAQGLNGSLVGIVSSQDATAPPPVTGRKQAITVDNTKVSGSVNLTNYPMLITLDYLNSEIVDGGSNSALNGGGDLRFYSDASLTTRLACEVVSFVVDATPGNRACIVWVKVPSVSYNSDTTIYVSYNQGETTQPPVTDPYGRNAVWSDYELVSHDSRTLDSSGNLTPTQGGTVDAGTNHYGGVAYWYNQAGKYTAWAYNGDITNGVTLQYNYENTATSTVNPVSVYTTSGWLRTMNKDQATSMDVRLGFGTAGNASSRDADSYENSGVSQNIWKNFGFPVADWVSDVPEPILDGNTGAGTSQVNYTTGFTPANEITVGILNSGKTNQSVAFGRISDVRLRLDVLTQDWIKTEVENQYNPATFASAGTPTDI